MVCVQVFEQFIVKMWEIQEYHKIGITSRSITVTLEAKESLMKHFHNKFYFKFANESNAFVLLLYL